MRKEDCKIGMIVICPEKFYDYAQFKEKTGTIVYIDPYAKNGSQEIGVEWDEPIEVITVSRCNGHSCGGNCKYGYGFFGSAEEIEPLNEPYEDEFEFKISIDAIF